MGKIIALDFGLKRTGIAISDELQMFAFGQETLESKNLEKHLIELVEKEKITEIVLGEPKRLNLEDSHITENVKLLYAVLRKTFPLLTIVLYDERFTSKMASRSINQMGLKKKVREDKKLIDQMSATILLQNYISSKE